MKIFFKKIKYLLYKSTNIYYFVSFYYLLNKFRKSLLRNDVFIKISDDSKDIYDDYSDIEQKEHDFESKICLFKNKLIKMDHKSIREEYLKYIYQEIDELLSHNEKIKIVEIGCGNCINIVSILDKYSAKVEITGIDISSKRIEVAKDYYANKLDGVDFVVADISKDLSSVPDNNFDLVFSMHCLEQITYNCSLAIEQMYRIAKTKLVLVEPVFENANPSQKIYLFLSDHNKTLLKVIKSLGYNIKNIEKLIVQENPLNQSTKIVIEKNNKN